MIVIHIESTETTIYVNGHYIVFYINYLVIYNQLLYKLRLLKCIFLTMKQS